MRSSETLTRFDGIALAVVGALGLALGVVLLRGDQIGVTVTDYGPITTAPGTAAITLRFSAAMQPETAETRFQIDPAVQGAFGWSEEGQILTFTPDSALQPETTYTVTLAAGAHAVTRQTVHDELRWMFTTQPPRVIALAPADALVYNLHVFDPITGESTPLTEHAAGIEDYAVSPDGRQIAYAAHGADSTRNLWLLDVQSGQTRPITQCVMAQCDHAAWSPNSTHIAYVRRDFKDGPGSGLTSARVWIVDLATLETHLLFDDPAQLGEDPTWSPAGDVIGVYDLDALAIRLHNLSTGSDTLIPTLQNAVGAFSPTGRWLVYPLLVNLRSSQQLYTHLALADPATGAVSPLTGPLESAIEDGEAVWSPDGAQLLIARRTLDAQFTPGKQLYLRDMLTGAATPLIVDANYNHSTPRWDATGQRILFQRFHLGGNGEPEIWTYDLATNTLRRITTNAFLPAWLP